MVERYKVATKKADKRQLLDQLCCSSDVRAAKLLLDLIEEPWERQRAALILTCRFGASPITGWAGWRNWLTRCERNRQQELVHLREFVERNSGELFLMWYSGQSHADTAIV